MITINSQKEMEKYYVKESNTYVFNDEVEFKCNIYVKSNINAYDINADNINAYNINAYNIDANDIIYYAVCFSYHNIKCKSIQGRRNNCKHFCLDGEIIYKTDTKEMTVAEISKELGYDIKIVKE
jgi:hypothetical protein